MLSIASVNQTDGSEPIAWLAIRGVWQAVMAMALATLESKLSAVIQTARCQRTPNDQAEQEKCHEETAISRVPPP
jgi:hypothetical protein